MKILKESRAEITKVMVRGDRHLQASPSGADSASRSTSSGTCSGNAHKQGEILATSF